MNEQQKREKIHQLLDLVLDVNGGVQRSTQSLTGNHPTAFFWYAGHTNEINIDVHSNGWCPDDSADTRYVLYLDMPEIDKCIDNVVEALEETIKKEGKNV